MPAGTVLASLKTRKQIEQITTNLLEWVIAIEGLLNPKPRWTLPYPCPNCGADKVYKPDSTGTPVRQYALALSPEGCTCGACKAHWPQGQVPCFWADF
jgi:hypothetical protein